MAELLLFEMCWYGHSAVAVNILNVPTLSPQSSTFRNTSCSKKYTRIYVHYCLTIKTQLLLSINKAWLNNLCCISKIAFPTAAKKEFDPCVCPKMMAIIHGKGKEGGFRTI